MSVSDALLRTLAFHYVWGHAPTRVEWIMTSEGDVNARRHEYEDAIESLVKSGRVVFYCGRFSFDQRVIDSVRESEIYIPRKMRVARRAAKWLASFSSVRFVALCNSTALGHAESESDLDFFVITRAGTIMITRALAALPYKILGRRPNPTEKENDAICLSYFVSDIGLDLSSHMLKPNDPYFRYWFLSLLPLYDDGISKLFWSSNSKITSKHPFAKPWLSSSDILVKLRIRFPVFSLFEGLLSKLQHHAFPSDIREIMNRDSRVLVSPSVLKFHVNDGRADYRDRYHKFCTTRDIPL